MVHEEYRSLPDIYLIESKDNTNAHRFPDSLENHVIDEYLQTRYALASGKTELSLEARGQSCMVAGAGWAVELVGIKDTVSACSVVCNLM